MDGQLSDPLYGHCLDLCHGKAFSHRRTGIQFFFMTREALCELFMWERCAPRQIVIGGQLLSRDA